MRAVSVYHQFVCVLTGDPSGAGQPHQAERGGVPPRHEQHPHRGGQTRGGKDAGGWDQGGSVQF